MSFAIAQIRIASSWRSILRHRLLSGHPSHHHKSLGQCQVRCKSSSVDSPRISKAPSLASRFDFKDVPNPEDLNSLGDKTDSTNVINLQEDTNFLSEIDVKASASELFDVLMSQESPESDYIKGPLQVKSAKLDPHYLHSLAINVENHGSITKLAEKQSSVISTQNSLETQHDTKQSQTLTYLTDLIHVNALANRPNEAQLAFNAIKANGLSPDMISFNQLMNAYAQSRDLKGALQVYDELLHNGVAPDIVSFSILIKACVAVGDLDSAFRLYADMKADHQLMPNDIVYTTLIKGCIKAKQFDRAWKTFDHLRENIKEPDNVCYNLMIHSCSQTKDAERALDLLEEMKQKQIPCDAVTFTSVLASCLSRRDFYHDAFGILEQMAAQGIQLNSVIYVTLLRGMARYGDLERARVIWNDFVGDVAEQKDLPEAQKTVRLEPQSISSMLSLCGKYLERLRVQQQPDQPLKEENIVSGTEPKEITTDVSEKAAPTHVSDVGESDIIPTETIQFNEITGIPMFGDESLTETFVVAWSHALYEYISSPAGMELTNENPVSQYSKDSYLRVLVNIPSEEQALEQATSFFNSLCTDRTLRTYTELLSLSHRIPDRLSEHIEPLLDDFHVWYERRDQISGTEAKSRVPEAGELQETEKERLRKMDGRDRGQVRTLFLHFANAYARAQEYTKAIEVIEKAGEFNYLNYLDPIKLYEIPLIIEGVNEMSYSGDWSLSKRLAQVCPSASLTPYEEGRRVLRNKTTPHSWLGVKIKSRKGSQDDMQYERDLETVRRRTKEKMRADSYIVSRRKQTIPKRPLNIRVFPGVVDLREKS